MDNEIGELADPTKLDYAGMILEHRLTLPDFVFTDYEKTALRTILARNETLEKVLHDTHEQIYQLGAIL